MLNVMQRDKLVYLILLALSLSLVTSGFFTWLVLIPFFHESWGWASVALGSLGLAGMFLGGLGHPRTVDWLWRKVPSLNRLVAPNLNGEYLLETSSNWPIQQRMLDCVEGRGTGHPASDTDDQFTVTGKLTIKQGLFAVKAVYIPDEQTASRSESFVVAASFELPGADDCFRFHYVYEGRVSNPIDVTDGERYRGAASFRIPEDSLDLLIGEYWTNRSWQKGINTAGKTQLRRTGHC